MHIAWRHSEVVRDPPERDTSRAAGVQPGNLSNFTINTMAHARRNDDAHDEAAGMQCGAISMAPARRDDDLDEAVGVQRGATAMTPARRDNDVRDEAVGVHRGVINTPTSRDDDIHDEDAGV
jgi:hypothetical protein